MTHTSWRCRRRRNRQQDREFREAQSRRARRRWDRVHAQCQAAPVRDRTLLRLTVERPGADAFPVTLEIRSDGMRRRRQVIESGEPWSSYHSRTALLHWFAGLLAGAGI